MNRIMRKKFGCVNPYPYLPTGHLSPLNAEKENNKNPFSVLRGKVAREKRDG